MISAYEIDDEQKCSRKRFLEMRSESEGMSQQQVVDRILNQNSDGSKKTVYAVLDENGKAMSDFTCTEKTLFNKSPPTM